VRGGGAQERGGGERRHPQQARKLASRSLTSPDFTSETPSIFPHVARCPIGLWLWLSAMDEGASERREPMGHAEAHPGTGVMGNSALRSVAFLVCRTPCTPVTAAASCVAVELMFVALRLSILQLRRKSLVRGTAVTLFCLWISFRLSGFPETHVAPWLVAPFLAVCAATWDTARCLQRRWNFYHGAVILLIYVDLMVLLMIAFLLLAPFSPALL